MPFCDIKEICKVSEGKKKCLWKKWRSKIFQFCYIKFHEHITKPEIDSTFNISQEILLRVSNEHFTIDRKLEKASGMKMKIVKWEYTFTQYDKLFDSFVSLSLLFKVLKAFAKDLRKFATEGGNLREWEKTFKALVKVFIVFIEIDFIRYFEANRFIV